MDRRHFLRQGVAALALVTGPASLWAAPGDHPEPRAGITAGKVVDPLVISGDAAEVFKMVREIPQIIDGIRCPCGCSSRLGMYSLLSCYESPGMAEDCHTCQNVARLAYRMFKDGKTLGDIREAVDKRWR